MIRGQSEAADGKFPDRAGGGRTAGSNLTGFNLTRSLNCGLINYRERHNLQRLPAPSRISYLG